jgi:hypothetical protein
MIDCQNSMEYQQRCLSNSSSLLVQRCTDQTAPTSQMEGCLFDLKFSYKRQHQNEKLFVDARLPENFIRFLHFIGVTHMEHGNQPNSTKPIIKHHFTFTHTAIRKQRLNTLRTQQLVARVTKHSILNANLVIIRYVARYRYRRSADSVLATKIRLSYMAQTNSILCT